LFLDPIPPVLLYIKPPLPINKQFSIDSFLDWEGLHWDFSSMFAYPPYYVTFSASAPMPDMLIGIHLEIIKLSRTLNC